MPLMNRSKQTAVVVAALKPEDIVVGGIGNNNFDLWASGRRPRNFYMLGSMGLTTSIGLGVAIARPESRVVVLEGDGSLLMELGSLGTVAAAAPKNLVVIVWDNGLYQITGSQKTLTSKGVDLVGVAKSSGIAKSFWAADERDFERLLRRALAEDGPWFIGAKTDSEKAAGVTERDPVRIKMNFMDGLGVSG
jgi:thiamine pyrophosphate-dependent acetolactate synthase large subunit-like protein